MKKRKGCCGCKICDLANKKYGKCLSGICACHLLDRNYEVRHPQVFQKRFLGQTSKFESIGLKGEGGI